MNTERHISENNDDNAFSITSQIGKVCIEQKIYHLIQIIVLFDLT